MTPEVGRAAAERRTLRAWQITRLVIWHSKHSAFQAVAGRLRFPNAAVNGCNCIQSIEISLSLPRHSSAA